VDVPTPDVRGAVESAAETFSSGVEAAQDVRPAVTDPNAVLIGAQDVGRREQSEFEQGLVGGLEGFNVPSTALAFEQGGRFAAARGREVARGESGQAVETTERAGREAFEGFRTAAEEQPLRTGGQVIGSLALTGAGLGATSAASGRAGQALRFGVQPGEEVIGLGGSRATRAIAGERAAETLFPGGEPVFLSEETAIRGAERGIDAARDVAGRTRVRGVGAGVPALEVETRQEQEERDPFEIEDDRDGVGPIFESELTERSVQTFRPTFESQLEQETQTMSELAMEIESERLRFQPDVGFAEELAEVEEIGQEIRQEFVQQERLDQRFGLDQELAQDIELETAQELRFDTETETETETELRRAETRREVSVPEFLDEDEDEERFLDRLFSGDRGVTAELTPTEIDFDSVGAEVEDVDQ
jgi:hypothetical protein